MSDDYKMDFQRIVMTNFFYTDANGKIKGPLNEQQLKELATQGAISPNTPLETDTGYQGTAEQIPGLFPPNPFAANPFSSSISAPVVVPTPATTIVAKNFRCNGCGASLEFPKNAAGHVKCTFCGNDCVLDGIITNAEIAAKENINSGVPLTATPSMLHSKLVSLLSESPYIPLDVFDKVEVVREERYCVAAYQFFCNGSASFTCQVGNIERVQEQSYEKGFLDDATYHVISTKNVTKWSPMSSTVSCTGTVFASGNKNLATPIQRLYSKYDPSRLLDMLVDIEELNFPADVVSYGYNLPEPAAFNEFAMPVVERILQKNAQKSLENKSYIKDFSLGGNNITKETVRVFLGLYRIVFIYEGQEYSMWATGDARHAWLEGFPIDPLRMKVYEEKWEKANESLGKVVLPGWTRFVIIMAFLTVWIVGVEVLQPVGLLVLAVGVIALLFISRAIMSDTRKTQLARTKADFEAFDRQRLMAVRRFQGEKMALRGIYKKVSGNAEAFDLQWS